MQSQQDLVDFFSDKQKGISYQITSFVDIEQSNISDNQCFVRAALVENTLSSSNAMFHALVPHDHIIELDALNRLLCADFQGSERAKFEPLLEQNKLFDVPALPHWQQLPCIVDSEVFFYDWLLLDLGNRRDVLKLSRDNFIKLIERSLRSRISSPVAQVLANTGDPSIEFAQRRLKQRINETLEVPLLSHSAQRIFELRAKSQPSVKELCDIIELDPSLAAQVLSWAASPYYKTGPDQIDSIHDAVVDKLGFEMVMNMVLGLALGKKLNAEAFNEQEQQQFSRHSVLIACICENLAQESKRDLNPQQAYICGLINDIGSLILGELFPLYKIQIDRILKANPHLRRVQVERYVTGCDSHDAATWTMENWNMPEVIIDSVTQCGVVQLEHIDSDYTKLILIAQSLLLELGITAANQTKISRSWWQELRISEPDARRRIKHMILLEDQLQPVTSDHTQLSATQARLREHFAQL
jgi:HD-like signal output (HDOD) protein